VVRRALLLIVPFLALALWPAIAAAQDAPTIQVKQDPKLGAYFVDANGMTLYLFKKDSPNTTVCYSGCAQAWPPLAATGALTLPDGVPGTLGTITRTDGTSQVTYNGTPLYHFAQDKAPGDVKGQGLGSVWYVLGPQAGATQLPKTGGVPIELGLMGGVGLAVGGLLLRRR
jgi:LPXTG-motif cell wall-anchored protein